MASFLSAKRLHAILFAFLILGLSSIPARDLPGPGFPGLDKALHFMVYAIFGILLARAGRGFAVAWCVGMAWGILDEYYQSFVPGRSPDGTDWIADALGVAFGAWVWKRFFQSRV
jgi:VanZ family protein